MYIYILQHSRNLSLLQEEEMLEKFILIQSLLEGKEGKKTSEMCLLPSAIVTGV